MKFNIFTLQPTIFDSFLTTSLVARGISQGIISVSRTNLREEYGVGGYKQIDDKPFGGGSGMVIQPEPIYNALKDKQLISTLFTPSEVILVHKKLLPNNSLFYQKWKKNKQIIRKVTISLSPRGYPVNQQIVEWIANNFDDIGILCGRYEGFDHRVSELVDIELSIGDFILNGGEVAAMCIIESVSRLLPGFVTKTENVTHDSFSSELNYYREQAEYVIGKRNISINLKEPNQKANSILFDDEKWKKEIKSKIEHPQYTRPEIWQNMKVPEVLLTGDHKKIQNWRYKWWDV